VNDLVGKMKVKGSDDNTIFYDYLRFLNKYRPEADSLKAKINRAKGNEADSVKYTRELEGLDKVVKKYQLDMIAKYPKSVCARMTKASLDPDMPGFRRERRTRESPQALLLDYGALFRQY
jgi:hypothetical protein